MKISYMNLMEIIIGFYSFSNMDVSIIIVNYNTMDLTRNCLLSIYEYTKNIDFEVIVSDNGSTDGSVEMVKKEFQQVILIENGVNLGFGTANNKGLEIAKGKYVFYLNSDTLLENNAVKYFYDYFEKYGDLQSIGALGTNLLDNYGEYTHSYGVFPALGNCIKYLIDIIFKNIIKSFLYIFGIEYRNRKDGQTLSPYIGEVDYITGADLFLKNNQYARFNPKFFLYYEETFLEYNMACNNLKRFLIEGPLIKHLTRGGKKKDLRQTFLSRSFEESFYSMIIYFSLQGKKFTSIVLAVLVTVIYLNPVFYFKNFLIIRKIWKLVNDKQ